MQLASETRDHEQKISSSIYVALIDSLFQNPAPLFAGAVLVAIAAVKFSISDRIIVPLAVEIDPALPVRSTCIGTARANPL